MRFWFLILSAALLGFSGWSPINEKYGPATVTLASQVQPLQLIYCYRRRNTGYSSPSEQCKTPNRPLSPQPFLRNAGFVIRHQAQEVPVQHPPEPHSHLYQPCVASVRTKQRSASYWSVNFSVHQRAEPVPDRTNPLTIADA